MAKVSKTFPGLGSVILMTDAFGNKTLQVDSLYCPVPYVVGTDKGLGMAENYLSLDKALYSGSSGQMLPLAERMARHAEIMARAAP